MGNSKASVCPTCGAVVFSDRCDLCGTPVGDADLESEISPEEEEPSRVEPSRKPDEQLVVAKGGERLVCPSCGAANRTDAKFCDQCGQGFASVDESRSSDTTSRREKPAVKPKDRAPKETEQGTRPRIGLYIAVAIAAVVGLYMLSVLTGGPSPSEPAVTQRPTPDASSSGGEDINTYLPEDQGLAISVAAKRDSIATATDPAIRQVLRQDLVETYLRAGRLDLAGREQEAVAEERNTADAWAAAGNLHFDWMEHQAGNERVKAAQRAARDYEKALEIDPDNLDVRSDLGVAYLNDPASPMLAIQNTNMVLEADSNHVQANFNKGVMLAQIGRFEEASKHFRKVISLSKPGDPAHDRALEVLDQLGTPAAGSPGASG